MCTLVKPNITFIRNLEKYINTTLGLSHRFYVLLKTKFLLVYSLQKNRNG